MSRIRSVHPGLWTDDAFMSLSAFARLLYIGLWNEAFDDGVFEWKPRTIKAKLFPADNVDVAELLAELVAADCIREGGGVGKMYGLIRNFRVYQRPKKPNSSGLLQAEDYQYVGLVPDQFPTSTEKSPQMEDGGGRVEEETTTSPSVPEPVGESLFDEVSKVFPRNPNGSVERARRVFERMTPAEQAQVMPAAKRFRQFTVEQAETKRRSFEEQCDFVPTLEKWLMYSWRDAESLPVKGMPNAADATKLETVEYLDRLIDDRLFAACERIRDKPVPSTSQRWAFPKEIVAKARAELAAA